MFGVILDEALSYSSSHVSVIGTGVIRILKNQAFMDNSPRIGIVIPDREGGIISDSGIDISDISYSSNIDIDYRMYHSTCMNKTIKPI